MHKWNLYTNGEFFFDFACVYIYIYIYIYMLQFGLPSTCFVFTLLIENFCSSLLARKILSTA
jgi:hypothetical protein